MLSMAALAAGPTASLGWASIVVVRDGMARAVFAHSAEGLAQFDEQSRIGVCGERVNQAPEFWIFQPGP